MTAKIVAEVWAYADTEQMSDLLLLLVMADQARDQDRLMWWSVEKLAYQARMSTSTAYRCLERLRRDGIIEDVAEEECPPEASKYSSIVRRITPPEQWPERSDTPDSHPDTSYYAEPDESPVSVVTSVSVTHKERLTNNLVTGRPSEETSSLHMTSVTGRVTTHTSARQRAAAAQAEEDALDPSKSLEALADPEPEPLYGPQKTSRTSGGPVTPPKPSGRHIGPAEALARHFQRLAEASGSQSPGAVNISALAKNATLWMREGFTQGQIQQMVEAYWSPTFNRREHKPAWLDFLGQRGVLMAQVRKVTKSQSDEANRYDDSVWYVPVTPRETDEED